MDRLILYKLENLITFEDYNALKVKIINVTLTANVATGDSISVNEIPNNAVFVTSFLYNYIKQEKMNIYMITGIYKFLNRTNV